MSLQQGNYELTAKGLKRTISNIVENTDTAFEAYYYNYLFRVEWMGNKIVASVKTPGGGVVLANREYPSKSQRTTAIKKCVETILDHYSQNNTTANHGKSITQEQTAS